MCIKMHDLSRSFISVTLFANLVFPLRRKIRPCLWAWMMTLEVLMFERISMSGIQAAALAKFISAFKVKALNLWGNQPTSHFGRSIDKKFVGRGWIVLKVGLGLGLYSLLYSWLSLSRPRLSRITAYFEVKIWSLPKHENLTTGKKYSGKEEKLLLFSTIFQYISNFKSPIVHIFVKCG